MYTRKIAALRPAFSCSCKGPQPLPTTVGPFGPNSDALRVQLKMLKIHLENFAEIQYIFFAKTYLTFFAEIRLDNFAKTRFIFFADIH